MNFSFVGQLGFNSMDSKMPWLREGKTKSGAEYQTLNMYVNASKNNRANMELFGMVSDKIKTKDTDRNDIEFDWDDRFDEDVIKDVADFRKFTIKIGDERKQFVTAWDAVDYIKEHIEDLKSGTFRVSGQVQKSIYKGNISDRFVIQNIYQVDEDSKCQLKVTGEFFFCKDSFDDADWREEKKLYINGWTRDFIDKDTGTKYVPQQIVLDASKINFENEKHLALLKYKLKVIGCELVDGKIKCKLGKNVYSIDTVLNYQNGAETVELTMDMLTDLQKEKVELGLASLDDFRTGSIYGERVTVYKLTDYGLKGKFSEGMVDSEMKISEFEDEILVLEKEETVDEVFEDKKKDDDKPPFDEDEDEEDLFS